MMRLDRLGPVKEVAHLAAALGREFSYELLAALSPMTDTELQAALAQLVRAELIYQRGAPPQSTYSFRHALIQEAAYQSLLKVTRQQYHRNIANALETRFPATVEARPEVVAHHCTAAGLTERAVTYWQRAGARAAERSANLEATHHFTTALELIRTLPESPQRTQSEIEAQVGLAVPLQLLRGYGAPEVEATYARARELCQAVGETPQIFPVLHGLWRFYLVRGPLPAARELADALLRMAEGSDNVDFALLAAWAQCATYLWHGDFAAALTHGERACALYDRERHGALALSYASDPKVTVLNYMAPALWYSGHPDRALACTTEAVAHAGQVGHPASLAWAIDFTAAIHYMRRDPEATLTWAENGISRATEQGFPLWHGVGLLFRSWALAESGNVSEAVDGVQQAMATMAGAGQEIGSTLFLALMAEVYGKAGKIDEAFQCLAAARALVAKNDEHFNEAHLHWLQGELLIAGDGARAASPEAFAAAEQCYRSALQLAAQQQAKSLELRAALSLARLLQQRGHDAIAQALLAPIYGCFSETSSAPELRDARLLLQRLHP